MKTHPTDKIGTTTTLYFNCINRQDLCWATPPRPKCSHYHHYTSIEEACILSLDNDNDTSRNDSSDNTRIPIRLSTHKYLDSCQLSNHHDPLTVLQRPGKIAIVDHRMRMFSDTAVIVKIPSEWENVSMIEYDHVSPLNKEAASCSCRTESGKSWAREQLERGGRRFELFGYRSQYEAIVAVQEIIVWLAGGIMLQIVLCL